MKSWMMVAALTALIGLNATTSRADDDECKTVVNALNEAIAISTKNFEATVDEVKKIMGQSADDKAKATVKNKFCSASGELLGTSRAIRAVAGECSLQRSAIASLDKSISEIETAIDSTCK